MFFKYTWNNFLHTQVEICIALILASPGDSTDSLISEQNSVGEHILLRHVGSPPFKFFYYYFSLLLWLNGQCNICFVALFEMPLNRQNTWSMGLEWKKTVSVWFFGFFLCFVFSPQTTTPPPLLNCLFPYLFKASRVLYSETDNSTKLYKVYRFNSSQYQA